MVDDLITSEVEGRLASVVDEWFPLDVAFDRVDALPGATCLLPADDGGLRRLTAELLRPWPHLQSTLRTGQRRPYHVTVAATEDRRLHDEIRSALAPLLPVKIRLAVVQLVVHDADRVRSVATIGRP